MSQTVFQNETWVEHLEAMIERRYANKRDAQKLAAGYVLEEIQSKTARFRQGLVDETRDIIEQFFEDYDAHMEKFSGVVPGEGWRVPFDAKAVFLGGVAGLGNPGGAWGLGGHIRQSGWLYHRLQGRGRIGALFPDRGGGGGTDCGCGGVGRAGYLDAGVSDCDGARGLETFCWQLAVSFGQENSRSVWERTSPATA